MVDKVGHQCFVHQHLVPSQGLAQQHLRRCDISLKRNWVTKLLPSDLVGHKVGARRGDADECLGGDAVVRVDVAADVDAVTTSKE